MKVLSVTVDHVPGNCGECCLMWYRNCDQPMCCALPSDINSIEGNPIVMKYRRSDCPLVVEHPVITRESKIKDLELSVRSYNCMKRHGVRTVGELADMSDEEFMKVRNLGRKGMEEVLGKLRDAGFDRSESKNRED